MKNINTIFCDIGGVMLTNGWDVDQRLKASETFKFDIKKYEQKHLEIIDDFECGFITLDEYLKKTIFYEARDFSIDEFKNFMKEQSAEMENNLEVLEELVNAMHYDIYTLNNESLELNEFRIKKFNLKKYFKSFFSSCYLETKKPGRKIFEIALNVTQNEPQNCLFIDDREENINTALSLGFNTIHYTRDKKFRELLSVNRII